MTPSEISICLNYKLKLLKIFPVGALGGVNFIKSIIGPFAHTGIMFSPTGGVNKENYESFLGIPQVISVGGTWVASREDINAGNWGKIKQNCLEITT
jgi:2-dehydro-3-deoxyphosphogluconate aldolase/(4S)-4-hydroxy-2-oxoglutarate aldolase